MRVRPHLDYCDFIYHIPKLIKKHVSDAESDVSLDGSEDDDENRSAVNDVVGDYDDYGNDDVAAAASDDDDDDTEAESHPTLDLNFRMRALESVQYQAALAVTGAWKGTNTTKIYQELGWESLHHRRCFRRITQFYKIMNGLTPQYLVDPIPMPRRHLFGRRITTDLYQFHWRNKRFLHSFYLLPGFCQTLE